MYTLTRDTLISIIIILFILLTNNIGGLAILGLPLMMLSSQRVKVQIFGYIKSHLVHLVIIAYVYPYPYED
ncbi:hypothetical protein DERP_007678 [Dermatophagoides pteronyssinus]|uniref:Uncharacterized protein n=1 Tax=Dermatophagoides pteronyssinus TaxID=6956 RepID=A0ABQ8JKF0_DERPT|nr:hypothetical protein DERP_007678 [Dermatophagoides pteronyssinus]